METKNRPVQLMKDFFPLTGGSFDDEPENFLNFT